MCHSAYDGHNYIPKGGWPTGLAFAKKLSGPWTRMPEGFNPKLKDGRYLMIFDSFGDQEIGYSLSADGEHWSRETRIKIQSADDLWAEPGDHFTHTPLCSVEEDNGTITVIYTAMTKVNGKGFYAIGRCTLAWR